MTDQTARRAWPTGTDYSIAVQQPTTAFADSSLAAGRLAMTPLGLPAVTSGQNAVVFRLDLSTGPVAIRCFIAPQSDGRIRYEALERHLASRPCPSLAASRWIDRGIQVSGQWYPVVVMPWVDGLPMNLAVEDHIGDRQALQRLASNFLDVVRSVQTGGLAHGDLQHGNVLVGSDLSVRLVDLDGVWVPGMAASAPPENGHPNYQHPRRSASSWGAGVDTFSAALIYLSLLAMAVDPEIVRFLGGESLVVTRDDLVAPGRTEAWQALLTSPDANVRALAQGLAEVCAQPAPPVCSADELLHLIFNGHVPSAVSAAAAPPIVTSEGLPLPVAGDWWETPAPAAFTSIRADPTDLGPSQAEPVAPAASRPGRSNTPTVPVTKARQRVSARLASIPALTDPAFGALAGLTASLVQGAGRSGPGDKLQGLVLIMLVASLLTAAVGSWPVFAARGSVEGTAFAAGGLALGAATGAMAAGFGDSITRSIGPVTAAEVGWTVIYIWTVAGVLIGLGVGAMRSKRALLAGVLGGLVAGAAGGCLVALGGTDFAQHLLVVDGASPDVFIPVTGAAAVLGLFIGLATRRVAQTSLSVIEGPSRGVTVPIYKSNATIGGFNGCTLSLPSLFGESAVLDLKMVPALLTTQVDVAINGDAVPPERHVLLDGDVVTIGGHVIRFNDRRGH